MLSVARCELQLLRAMYPDSGYSSETGGIMENLRTSTNNTKVNVLSQVTIQFFLFHVFITIIYYNINCRLGISIKSSTDLKILQ